MTEPTPDRMLPLTGSDRDPRPIDWLETCLARIAESNDTLRAVVALDRDGARRAAADSAARWRSAAPLSAIDGAPVLVKANIAVAGLDWHAGIAAYGERVARADAAAIARLRAAGAVILGLTNMDEGALGASGDNPWLGRIGNPRYPGTSAGGSSGGSAAAVAAGYCMAALGTDTIGSIAIPAAYCGITGHRASRAVLPLAGIVPLSPTFDHAGWHTRSAADALTIGRALGLATPDANHVRIAALTVDALGLPPEVRSVMETSAARAQRSGWQVDRLILPVASGEMARRMFEVAEADAAIVHGRMLTERPEGFSPTFRRLLEWGARSGAQRRADNLAVLWQLASDIRAALAGYDALLMPAAPHAGFAAGALPPPGQALFAAVPACLGWPATTFPAGRDRPALLVTAPSDGMCLAIADRIAENLP